MSEEEYLRAAEHTRYSERCVPVLMRKNVDNIVVSVMC